MKHAHTIKFISTFEEKIRKYFNLEVGNFRIFRKTKLINLNAADNCHDSLKKKKKNDCSNRLIMI